VPQWDTKGGKVKQKTARLNMRMTPEIRQKLEEEAARLGLSLAAVARIKLTVDLSSLLEDVPQDQSGEKDV